MKKRYAIVRVDNKCPAYEDNIFCGRIEYFKHTDNDYYEHRVEQVPETFEELKELCKDLESKSITIYDGAITIDFPSINGGFNFYIYITEKEIDINSSVFAQNRTIPQLWAFIKSLIGEE